MLWHWSRPVVLRLAPFSGAVPVFPYGQALVAAPGGKADCVPSLLCRAGCAQGATLKAKKHEGTVRYIYMVRTEKQTYVSVTLKKTKKH